MRFKKKFLVFFAPLFVLFLMLTGCGKQEDKFTLTIGMEAAYPPFNWTENSSNSDNVPIKGKNNEFAAGYDIAVAKYIAEENDWNLEVVAMEWDSLIPSLQSGTINAIAAGMSATTERKQSIDFSDPYYSSTLYLVARKNDSRFKNDTNFDFEKDLKGVKLVTQSGTFEDDIAADWARDFGAKHIEGTTDYPTAFLQVAMNHADAVICEYPVAQATVNANANLDLIPFDNSKLDAKYIEQTQIAIGLAKTAPKEMPDLEKKINVTLSKLSSDTRKEWMDKAIAKQAEGEKAADLGQQIGSLLSNYWVTFGYGVLNTLLLSIVGTLVGLLIGIFIGQVRNVKITKRDGKAVRCLKRIGRGLAFAYVTFFRGTPMMVQAMILFSLTPIWTNIALNGGIGNVFNGYMLCGMIIICINTGAYMTENVRSGMNGVDKGQSEAALSLGIGPQRTLWGITLPQALKNSLPTIGNEFIVNIKDSSVLNVIGLTELYRSVSIATRTNYFTVAGYIIVAVIYLILTLVSSIALELISNKMSIPNKVNWFGIRRTTLENISNFFKNLGKKKEEAQAQVSIPVDGKQKLMDVETIKKLQKEENKDDLQ